MVSCYQGMDLGDDGSSFSHRRSNALGRSGAHIPYRKDPGNTGLERKSSCASRNEAALVARKAMIRPAGIRIRSDEQEQMAQLAPMFRPVVHVAERGGGQPGVRVAFESDDLGPDMDLDVGQGAYPIHQIA